MLVTSIDDPLSGETRKNLPQSRQRPCFHPVEIKSPDPCSIEIISLNGQQNWRNGKGLTPDRSLLLPERMYFHHRQVKGLANNQEGRQAVIVSSDQTAPLVRHSAYSGARPQDELFSEFFGCWKHFFHAKTNIFPRIFSLICIVSNSIRMIAILFLNSRNKCKRLILLSCF